MPTYRNYYGRPAKSSKAPLLIIIVLAALAIAIAAFTFLAPAQQAKQANSASTSSSPDAPINDRAATSEAQSDAPLDVVVTLGGSKDTYVLVGEEYLEPGCHVVENHLNDITDTVEISGKVDTSKPGDYEVVYTATTTDGRKVLTGRNVHVVESFEQNATSIPVLMYHYVYTVGDEPEVLNNNYILDTKLAQQCEYLSSNGYYYPSFQEIRAFVEGKHTLPAKSVVLTFDDAEVGFLKYGIPVLNEYKVPATSFVICSDVDAVQKVLGQTSEYVQFQSHSYDMHHGNSGIGQGGIIHAMSKDEILEDVRKSHEILHMSDSLAYPFGDTNEQAWSALREAGLQCAFTVKNDRIYPGDNPFALNRVRLSGEYDFESFVNLVAPNA